MASAFCTIRPSPLSGATAPLKVYLCNAAGADLSASAITLTALAIEHDGVQVKALTGTFKFDRKLGPSGGYKFDAPISGLPGGHQLRAQVPRRGRPTGGQPVRPVRPEGGQALGSRPDTPGGHRTGVELEDGSAHGRLDRIVEVDAVDDADELATERQGPGDGTEDVPEERQSLGLVQLGRGDLLVVATHRDRRATRGAQVAHPMDVAPGRPDPAPAVDRDDRDRRGPGLAARSGRGW